MQKFTLLQVLQEAHAKTELDMWEIRGKSLWRIKRKERSRQDSLENRMQFWHLPKNRIEEERGRKSLRLQWSPKHFYWGYRVPRPSGLLGESPTHRNRLALLYPPLAESSPSVDPVVDPKSSSWGSQTTVLCTARHLHAVFQVFTNWMS